MRIILQNNDRSVKSLYFLQITTENFKMPKEMITIELRRSPGQPWGMRIGGGVDRGKVLVLEKVRILFSSICICRIAFNIWSNKKYICMKKPFEHFHGALEMSILMDNDCMRIVALLLDVIYIDVVQNSGNISKTWVIWHSCSI